MQQQQKRFDFTYREGFMPQHRVADDLLTGTVTEPVIMLAVQRY